MVLPAEADHRAKRRALSLCQDHLRKVMDMTRKTTQLIDLYVRDDKDSAKELYKEIQDLGDDIDATRRTVSRELAEIGAILLNREDYLRFTYLTSEIADFGKGVAFRLLEIMERRWDVPADVKKRLLNLADAVFEAISKLREVFITLNYGSSVILEKARDVEVAERTVDDLYRELEISILESNMKVQTLLLMRDIIQLLEDTADKIEDASDAARILAFAL